MRAGLSVAAGIHHVAIRARDVMRVASFYRDVLGLPEIPCPREGPVWFAAGESILMIEPRDHGSGVGAPCGIHVLALAIPLEERASWEQRLTEAGVNIERRSACTLYVRDPEGNEVGLSHFPRPAP